MSNDKNREDDRAAVMELVRQAEACLRGAEAIAEKWSYSQGDLTSQERSDFFVAGHCRAALDGIERIKTGSA